ncbi:MAG: hypothetical protein TREMPRED_004744 [Tremellales sp. Tagirdzhanova-0007]|nr:MAG: hypothetical protein TREMPRED_004744 [Tremellales sp. Tagirdzhanova-0007]
MPIDPDAYMSGAIPTLSRGGSWMPGNHPGGATYPKYDPSFNPANQTVPHEGGGSLVNNPRYFPGSPFSGPTHSGFRAPSACGPMSHAGWAHDSSLNGVANGPVMGPVTPQAGSVVQPGAVTMRRVANHNVPPVSRIRLAPSVTPTGRASFRDPSTIFEGDSWEEQAGAPKPRTPESVYPPPSGWVDPRGTTAPMSARPEGLWTVAPHEQPIRAHKIGIIGHEDARVYRQRAESLPSPPAVQIEAKTSKNVQGRKNSKSGMSRASFTSTSDEGSKRSASHHDSAYDSTLTEGRYSSIRSSSTPRSTPIRPTKVSSTKSSSSAPRPNSKSGPPSSPSHKSSKHMAQTLSTPHLSELAKTSPSPGKYTPGSRSGFTTSYASDAASEARRSAHTAMANPFTSVRQGLYPPSRPPGSVRTMVDASPGYIPPFSEQGYDRYAAHPAAPVPDRLDRDYSAGQFSSAPLRANDGVVTSTEPGVNGVARVDQIDVKAKGETTKTYLPLGYATPPRDMVLNRTGPAMARHGVAWGRHEDGLILPDVPEGPRWLVAKPPRDGEMRGGGWWESGGEGGANAEG